jgi:xanthine dehydrogenase iron-sulfur cluster and FAD-binding subunit A
MSCLEHATTDLATTKQYYHIRTLMEVIKVAQMYIIPFQDGVLNLLKTENIQTNFGIFGKDFSQLQQLVKGILYVMIVLY